MNPCVQPVWARGVQVPDWHCSSAVQSESWEHAHCVPVCVPWQVACGPHWLLDVQD
jgi:hypothetical protein